MIRGWGVARSLSLTCRRRGRSTCPADRSRRLQPLTTSHCWSAGLRILCAAGGRRAHHAQLLAGGVVTTSCLPAARAHSTCPADRSRRVQPLTASRCWSAGLRTLRCRRYSSHEELIPKTNSKTARSGFFWPLGCTRFFSDFWK